MKYIYTLIAVDYDDAESSWYPVRGTAGLGKFNLNQVLYFMRPLFRLRGYHLRCLSGQHWYDVNNVLQSRISGINNTVILTHELAHYADALVREFTSDPQLFNSLEV